MMELEDLKARFVAAEAKTLASDSAFTALITELLNRIEKLESAKPLGLNRK